MVRRPRLSFANLWNSPMSPLFLFITLLLGACAAYTPWRSRSVVTFAAIVPSVLACLIAVGLALPSLLSGESWVTDWWYIDSFSGLLLVLIALLSVAAVIVSTGYLQHEQEERIVGLRQVRFYYASLHLFTLGMMATVISNNIMVLWLALESTTPSPALLLAF